MLICYNYNLNQSIKSIKYIIFLFNMNMNDTINIPTIYRQYNNGCDSCSECSNSSNSSSSNSSECSDNIEIEKEPISILTDINTPSFKQESYITTAIKTLSKLHHKHYFYMFDEIKPIFFDQKKIEDCCIVIYPTISQISLFDYFDTLDIDLFTHRFILHYAHLKKGIEYMESTMEKKKIIPITFIIDTDNELPLISFASFTNTDNTYSSLLDKYFINILCSVPHERNPALDAWKNKINH